MSGITFKSGISNYKGTPYAISDTYANLVNYLPDIVGALYFAIDGTTETILQADGSAWVPLAGTGGTPDLQMVTDIGASSTNTLTLSGTNGIFTDPINGFYSLGFGNSNLGGGGFEVDDSVGTNRFVMGQYSGLGNQCLFQINDQTGSVSTEYNGAAEGINMDIINKFFYFGSTIALNAYLNFDGNVGNAIYNADQQNIFQSSLHAFDINAVTGIIKTTYGAVDAGIFLDAINSDYRFGDTGVSVNGTQVQIFDGSQQIQLYSGIGKYKFSFVATYATNAAAVAGGLVTGEIYKNAAGVLSIVL